MQTSKPKYTSTADISNPDGIENFPSKRRGSYNHRIVQNEKFVDRYNYEDKLNYR